MDLKVKIVILVCCSLLLDREPHLVFFLLNFKSILCPVVSVGQGPIVLVPSIRNYVIEVTDSFVPKNIMICFYRDTLYFVGAVNLKITLIKVTIYLEILSSFCLLHKNIKNLLLKPLKNLVLTSTIHVQFPIVTK